MGIVVTFALNAVLNLVVGLAVAGVLGPDEFGRYAIAAAVAVVIGTALFEWLRLSATRFSAGRDGIADAGFAASLDGLYWVFGLASITVAVLVDLVAGDAKGLVFGFPRGMLSVIAIAAVATGLFELATARARALFRNDAYIRLVLAKNVLALLLMIAVAYWTRSAMAVLAMLALSAVAALAVGQGRTRPRIPPLAGISREHLAFFARYGLPLVATNLAYQGILLLNRSVVAQDLGFADAGRLSLATDLTLRLLVSAGAAIDAFMFQLAVRRHAEEGAPAGRRQLAANMVAIGAILTFLAISYAAAMPALEVLFVPAAYHGAFEQVSFVLIPGMLAYCLLQFALYPVFQLAGRTHVLLWATLVALAVDVGLIAAAPRDAGLVAFAWIHAASLGAGFVAALVAARSERGCWPSWKDVGAVVLAGGCALGAMWPLRELGPPIVTIVCLGVVGATTYVAVLGIADVGGWRSQLIGRFRRSGPTGA